MSQISDTLLKDIVGHAATVVATGLQLPLIYSIYRQKNADNISPAFICGNLANAALWFTYGYILQSTQLIVTDAIYFFMYCFIIYLKVYYLYILPGGASTENDRSTVITAIV